MKSSAKTLGEEPSTRNFDRRRYEEILVRAKQAGRIQRYFRPAYRPGLGFDLLQSLQQMIEEDAANKILFDCHDLFQVATFLQRYEGVGSFFAAQWTLDLAYGPHLTNTLDDFCLAGPGGMTGLALCFMPRAWTYQEINGAILMLHSRQQECFQLVTGKPAPRLVGCSPAPMDLQNFCCETQKWLLLSADPYRGQGGKQEPPALPNWWHNGPSKEREEARMMTDYEQRKREGKIASTRLLGRLKERIRNYENNSPETSNS